MRLNLERVKPVADYLLCVLFIALANVFLFHERLYQYLCKAESYAGNVYGRMAVLEATEEDNAQRPIALIGDSHVEEGIGAKQLSELTGIPVVNLALPGTGPLVWLHYLRSIDPDRHRFRAIVLLVPLLSVRSDATDDGAQSLLPVARTAELLEYVSRFQKSDLRRDYYYGSIDRMYGFRRDVRDLILNPSRLLTNGKERQAFMEKVRNWPGELSDVCGVKRDTQSGKILKWGDLTDPFIRRLAQHNSRMLVILNHRPESDGLAFHLGRIFQHYNNSTTTLVLVTSPFGMGHHVAEDAPALRPYFQFVEHASTQQALLHWNATSEALFRDCSNFFDYRHLNVKGRQLFTSRLAEILAEKGLLEAGNAF